MKCPHCNQEHEGGKKFCPNTGKRILPTLISCPNPNCINYARNVLPRNYQYCDECGSALNKEVDKMRTEWSSVQLCCPNCGSIDIVDDGSGWMQYKCQDCGKIWGDPSEKKEKVSCPVCGSENGHLNGDFFDCDDCEKYYYISGCPSCGSHNVTDDRTNWFQYQCNECEHIWGTPLSYHEITIETSKDKKGNSLSNYFDINGFILGLSTYDEIWGKSCNSNYNPKEHVKIDGVLYKFKEGVFSEAFFDNIENLPVNYRKLGFTKNKDIIEIANILEKGFGFSTDIMAPPLDLDYQSAFVSAKLPMSTKYGKWLELCFDNILSNQINVRMKLCQ